MYIITTVFIAQLMFVNAGFIVYTAINWYSYLQMKLTTSKKKIFDTNTIDYLIGDYLTTENCTYNALNEINRAYFAVLICKGTDMVCFYPPIEEYKPEYELSDIQFISVKVVIDSVEHNVRLRTPEYTFYIVGNELNVDWVRYYFCKYLNIPLSSDVQYEMTIIDDNVQFVVINQDQSIVINKDSYDVFDYVDQEEDDDHKDLFGEEVDDNGVDDEDQDHDEDQNLNEDQEVDDEDQNLAEDPTELSVDRMIQLEEEIRDEIQQQQQQPPLEYDLNIDNMIDQIIADYDMSNMVIFSQDNVALVDVSNNLLEEEKSQGWFNMF